MKQVNVVYVFNGKKKQYHRIYIYRKVGGEIMLDYTYGRSGEIIAYYDYVRVFTVDNWTEAREEEQRFMENLYR